MWKGWRSQRQVWRLLVNGFASFAGVLLTDQAVYNRIRQAPQAMQALFEQVSRWVREVMTPLQEVRLAPFAREVLVLDERTLDQVKRWLQTDRQTPKEETSRLAGRICGLFDVRRQQWVRLDIFPEAGTNCKVHARAMLEGLQAKTLLLFDLGYYAFEWFDDLSEAGISWISRQRERATVKCLHVISTSDVLCDELVRLGAYRSDHAAKMARLISIWYQGKWHRYLTNVLDPHQLSAAEVARLYARRWDIELAFRVLKEYLGLRLLWGARWEVIAVQIWACAILAQVLHSWQVRLAWQEQVEPGEISLLLLREQASTWMDQGESVSERVHTLGRAIGLIRPSTRKPIEVAEMPWQGLAWPPPQSVWIMDPPRYAHKPAGNANRKQKPWPQSGPSG